MSWGRPSYNIFYNSKYAKINEQSKTKNVISQPLNNNASKLTHESLYGNKQIQNNRNDPYKTKVRQDYQMWQESKNNQYSKSSNNLHKKENIYSTYQAGKSNGNTTQSNNLREYKQIQDEINRKQKKLEQINRQIRQVQGKLQIYNNSLCDMAHYAKYIQNYSSQKKKLNQEKRILMAQIQQLHKQLQFLTASINKSKTNNQHLQSLSSQHQQNPSSGSRVSIQSNSKKQIQSLTQTLKQYQYKNDFLNTQNEGLKKQIKNLEAQIKLQKQKSQSSSKQQYIKIIRLQENNKKDKYIFQQQKMTLLKKIKQLEQQGKYITQTNQARLILSKQQSDKYFKKIRQLQENNKKDKYDFQNQKITLLKKIKQLEQQGKQATESSNQARLFLNKYNDLQSQFKQSQQQIIRLNQQLKKINRLFKGLQINYNLLQQKLIKKETIIQPTKILQGINKQKIKLSPQQREQQKNQINRQIIKIKPQQASLQKYEKLIDLATNLNSILSEEQCEPKYIKYKYKQLINLYNYIIQDINKNQQFQNILAFAYVQLLNIQFQTASPDKKVVEELQNILLNIYDRNETIYFEQKIVLLNNIALFSQSDKALNKSSATYLEIIRLQQKYFSKADQRALMTKNNLACLYAENKIKQKARLFFNDCFKLMREAPQKTFSKDVQNLINQNYKFYFQN